MNTVLRSSHTRQPGLPDSTTNDLPARPAFRHPWRSDRGTSFPSPVVPDHFSTQFGRPAERRRFAHVIGSDRFVGGQYHHLAAAPRPAVTGAPRDRAEGAAPARPTGHAAQTVPRDVEGIRSTLDHRYSNIERGRRDDDLAR